MRVRLVKEQTIEDYVGDNARSKTSFNKWLTLIKVVEWETTEDITNTFGTADFLGKSSNRIVFDIGGNNYRMICHYFFGKKFIHLYICWIGTHAEYDELCDVEEQYTVNKY